MRTCAVHAAAPFAWCALVPCMHLCLCVHGTKASCTAWPSTRHTRAQLPRARATKRSKSGTPTMASARGPSRATAATCTASREYANKVPSPPCQPRHPHGSALFTDAPGHGHQHADHGGALLTAAAAVQIQPRKHARPGVGVQGRHGEKMAPPRTHTRPALPAYQGHGDTAAAPPWARGPL